jgi:hypothetical protein
MMSPTTPELPMERCGNCACSRPADDASGVLHSAGWMQCGYQRQWCYVSPRHPCHFSPSKWQAKPEVRG